MPPHTNVEGSDASKPYRKDATKRDAHTLAPVPIATPRPTSTPHAAQHHANDVRSDSAPRAIRMPISAATPVDGVRRHAVEPEARQQQCKAAEERRQSGEQPFLDQRRIHLAREREEGQRRLGVGSLERLADSCAPETVVARRPIGSRATTLAPGFCHCRRRQVHRRFHRGAQRSVDRHLQRAPMTSNVSPLPEGPSSENCCPIGSPSFRNRRANARLTTATRALRLDRGHRNRVRLRAGCRRS